MVAPAVVALEVVLHDDLPVGGDLVGLPERFLETLGPGVHHLRGERIERRGQWRRGGLGERDEDEPVPDLHVTALQTPRFVVEVGRRTGDVRQASIESIAPLVVGADEAPYLPVRLVAQSVTTVAAGVEQCVESTPPRRARG